MPLDRIRLGRAIALALARHDVQELRPAQLLHVAERADQRFDVVAVHGSYVIEPHLLEQRAGQHHALQMLLGAAGELPHRRHLPQYFLAAFAQLRVHAAGERARQVVGEGAHVLGDRHVVVVQDDQQIRRQRACVIQRLERHSRRERAVADDRHRPAIFAAFRRRDRHAERGTDRSARVTDAEGVVLTLAAGRKGCEAAVLLDGVQQLAATGEHLVRVRLMADVPHQPVVGRIENVMQRHGQLDRAQAGGEVAAAGRDALNQELPQLIRHGGQLGGRQAPQILGHVDGFEQGVSIGRRDHFYQFIPAASPAGIRLRRLLSHKRHRREGDVAAVRSYPL